MLPTLRRLCCLALAGLGACSYTSEYLPPGDGRARVVWQGGEAVASVPALGDACRAAAFQAARAPQAAPVMEEGPGYYGPHPHVVFIDHASWIDVPYLGPPPLVHFGPSPHGPPLPPTPPVGGPHRAMPAPKPGKAPSGPSLNSGGNSGSELWVAAAVVAIATMPVIALALALSRPESEKQAAGSVDLVNAYNDQLRTAGSPCALQPPQAAPPLGDGEVAP